MATYKNINGSPIQYLESDPANPVLGQVWFNSTSKTLKGTFGIFLNLVALRKRNGSKLIKG